MTIQLFLSIITTKSLYFFFSVPFQGKEESHLFYTSNKMMHQLIFISPYLKYFPSYAAHGVLPERRKSIQQGKPAKKVPPAHPHLQEAPPRPRSNSFPMQAAQIVGINYLTAKTIVFFHKNNHKTYQFDLDNTHKHGKADNCLTASVVTLKRTNSIQEKLNYPKSRIEVICSIGNILSPSASIS